MNPEVVKAWLRRRNRAAMGWNLAGAVGLMLAGVVVLYVSFWVCYGVIWFVSSPFLPVSHGVRLLLSAGFILLVVVVGARQNWEDIDPLRQQVRMAKDMDITFSPFNQYGVSLKTDAVKAGAFEVRSIAAVCNAVLCGGAKLLIGGVRSLRRFWRLRSLEVDGCARVLALLAAQGRRQSFTEIVQKIPGLNPVRTFDDLRYVEGVLFLSNEPPGLTLHPDLKAELSTRTGEPAAHL